ncbi:uncharacterized protein KZ484_017975 [Pholidichthys leucotaenia]
MEMMMILLVSAVALISPAVASPTHHLNSAQPTRLNLKNIIELVESYNKTLTKGYFVEDVKYLADKGCNDTFFCKVHEVLKNHSKNKDEHEIVSNLRMYIRGMKMNCEDLLRTVKKPPSEKPIPDLLESLRHCSQKRNFI